MFSKKSAIEVREVREIRTQGNKRQVTNSGERRRKTIRANLPAILYTTFMVVIHLVRNGNNNQIFSMQLCTLYRDVRRWEELIYSIEKDHHP
jgi:hypothetical protein